LEFWGLDIIRKWFGCGPMRVVKGNCNCNGKGKSKSNGKRREASLRQSGSAFGAAFIGRAEALPFRSVTPCRCWST